MGDEDLLRKESPYWPALGGPIFLFLLGLFFFARPLLLLEDGGTCRHILSGLYFFDKHTLPTTTYISAIESSPWTTHELLCDLLFGLPFRWLGLNWVVLTSSLAIALSLTWSYQMARWRGCGAMSALAALILALEAGTVHWSARPHVFTYPLFLACYYECFIAQRTLRMRAIVLSVIMLIWGNIHGSFTLGLAMIFARGTCDLLSHTGADADEKNWSFKDFATAVIPALICACLNLRGAGFAAYVFSYMTNPKIQAHSDEWRSIDFSFALPVWSFMALACLLFLCWVYAKVKPRLGEFMYLLFLFCASIYAMRLIPYFTLAALPALAAQAGELRLRESLLAVPLLGKLLAIDNRSSISEMSLLNLRWVFVGAAAVLGCAFLLVPGLHIKDFDPSRMPVAAVDYLQSHKISGLGFTKDNWGSYLYWRTNEKIFMDDATDFYSQRLIDDYSSIFLTTPGWESSLKKYPFNFILIPRGLPLQFMLAGNAAAGNWKTVYEDQTAVLFTK